MEPLVRECATGYGSRYFQDMHGDEVTAKEKAGRDKQAQHKTQKSTEAKRTASIGIFFLAKQIGYMFGNRCCDSLTAKRNA